MKYISSRKNIYIFPGQDLNHLQPTRREIGGPTP